MTYRPKVLIVENEQDTLRMFESTLKVLGSEPRCLASSWHAAEIINREKFDGAFLSWDTPDLSGRDLTQRIRTSKSNSRMPIAMLTASTDCHALVEGFNAGVTFFLSKPVGPRELQRLASATRGPMLEERLRYHRVPLPAQVVCSWGDKRITGRGVDISCSGLLLIHPLGPALSVEVTLDFTLPRTRQSMKLHGMVARTGVNGQVGIKFLRITADEHSKLKSYVNKALASLPVWR